ncbi:hypothetical protein [Demequina zhanjiangensis]|uniref:Uncharacterized protein n=1 Tax=Demequina zhanjiangensis TaxID=3051659 RepID=A0ABT8FYF4_9MICO|nr:hypothetical protein [Demequina sp. SYSU T00b26]MDN4471843.1 hypothetical protein [Demequina sp. SYSU T00b26]
MEKGTWREPTAEERALLQAWLDSWNRLTGDTGEVAPTARARTTCSCGTCADFDLSPVRIERSHVQLSRLPVSAKACDSSGEIVAGLIAWNSGDDVIGLEIQSYVDEPVILGELTFTFDLEDF